MEEMRKLSVVYLEYCYYQKNLNTKTLKAYSIDLKQFISFMEESGLKISKAGISGYITQLHKLYKPKSIKRKIACLKAFFSYLEYEPVILIHCFDYSESQRDGSFVSISKPFGQYEMVIQLSCIFAAGLIHHFLNDSVFCFVYSDPLSVKLLPAYHSLFPWPFHMLRFR